MTQVQTMTTPELNRALAVLMGYTEDKRYPGRVIKGTAVTMPKDFCTDPAASLEVQEKATRIDAGGYIQNLLTVMFGETVYEREFSNRLLDFMTAAKINNSTPRQRAEAAYITLREAK
ncbi:hypothetical protein [Paenibacillus sp. IHBB 3054]|uniref:hypothetical protein n=1 Tax=Paenibacillus sp. IHBB 3054 TaxID=3425689 RepID=UPI003F663247